MNTHYNSNPQKQIQIRSIVQHQIQITYINSQLAQSRLIDLTQLRSQLHISPTSKISLPSQSLRRRTTNGTDLALWFGFSGLKLSGRLGLWYDSFRFENDQTSRVPVSSLDQIGERALVFWRLGLLLRERGQDLVHRERQKKKKNIERDRKKKNIYIYIYILYSRTFCK